MPEPYIGEIRMFAGNFAPAGWALCNGAMLPISEYDTLFNLIGTTYGGDGQETFGLPSLASRVPLHMGSNGGVAYQIGEASGTESETLSTQQIPQHSHAFTANGAVGTSATPGGNVPAQVKDGVMLYREVAPAAQMNATMYGPSGGSQPHENLQPYLVINFIISLFGIYPQPT
jgi:microcystin-dependent protein